MNKWQLTWIFNLCKNLLGANRKCLSNFLPMCVRASELFAQQDQWFSVLGMYSVEEIMELYWLIHTSCSYLRYGRKREWKKRKKVWELNVWVTWSQGRLRLSLEGLLISPSLPPCHGDLAEMLLALRGCDNIVHYVQKPGSNNNIHQINNAMLTHNYTKLQRAGISEVLVQLSLAFILLSQYTTFTFSLQAAKIKSFIQKS